MRGNHDRQVVLIGEDGSVINPHSKEGSPVRKEQQTFRIREGKGRRHEPVAMDLKKLDI